jgi:hypothetical protein
MARSSHNARRGPQGPGPSTVAKKLRPMPRVVRLGRPANDNVRQSRLLPARLLFVALATALTVVALYDWRLI